MFLLRLDCLRQGPSGIALSLARAGEKKKKDTTSRVILTMLHFSISCSWNIEAAWLFSLLCSMCGILHIWGQRCVGLHSCALSHIYFALSDQQKFITHLSRLEICVCVCKIYIISTQRGWLCMFIWFAPNVLQSPSDPIYFNTVNSIYVIRTKSLCALPEVLVTGCRIMWSLQILQPQWGKALVWTTSHGSLYLAWFCPRNMFVYVLVSFLSAYQQKQMNTCFYLLISHAESPAFWESTVLRCLTDWDCPYLNISDVKHYIRCQQ